MSQERMQYNAKKEAEKGGKPRGIACEQSGVQNCRAAGSLQRKMRIVITDEETLGGPPN
jgi:hypothetical protein